MNKTSITIFWLLTGGLLLPWLSPLVAQDMGTQQPALQRLIENALKNAPNAVSIAKSMAVIAPTLISAAAIQTSVRSKIHWALVNLS